MPTSVIVVTVTESTVTSTSQPTSSQSELSSGAVAGIVIGTLIGGVLFIILVLYLLSRYSRRNPSRASNPAYDHVPTAGGSDQPYLELPSARSRRYNQSMRHSQQPSLSSEPLMSVNHLSRSPLPPTPRVQSPTTPPRVGSISPNPSFSTWDLGEITRVARHESVSHVESPTVSNTPPPPVRPQDQTSLRSQQTMFVHRMLKSRAQATDGFALEHRLSIPSRSTTLSSSAAQPDEERLLAEAEYAALQDAGMDQSGFHEEEGELHEESVDDTDSLYSQLSAALDHVTYFPEAVPRQNGSVSTPRRVSSRRRPRTPAVPAELPPVAEVPDVPNVPAGQRVSFPVSAAENSSRHGRASPVLESIPLLTSANFGKGSSSSGTPPGSLSSNTGWTSHSSGRASRYPSLAASSAGKSSRSGPHSDGGTIDWRHPPRGLAGLKTLQIGPMHNPHSPVDEHPEVSLPANVAEPPAPVKRAHLREGTTCSVPEMERRCVTQGGIASIEVAL